MDKYAFKCNLHFLNYNCNSSSYFLKCVEMNQITASPCALWCFPTASCLLEYSSIWWSGEEITLCFDGDACFLSLVIKLMQEGSLRPCGYNQISTISS